MARHLVPGKVVAALEERGHRLHAIDLPRHEADPTVALETKWAPSALKRAAAAASCWAIRSAAFEARAAETITQLKAAN